MNSSILQDCLNLLLQNQRMLTISGGMHSESILGSIPCASLELTPDKQGAHWSTSETDTVVPLNHSDIFTPRKISSIEGRDEAHIQLESSQITLNGQDPEPRTIPSRENLEWIKETASCGNLFKSEDKKSEVGLDIVIDIHQEREKRKQRRSHLNNVDSMVERIDHLGVQKSYSNLTLERTASYTELKSEYPKPHPIVKRGDDVDNNDAYSPHKGLTVGY